MGMANDGGRVQMPESSPYGNAEPPARSLGFERLHSGRSAEIAPMRRIGTPSSTHHSSH